MSDDYIATKKLVVEVQENGIIRRADTGYLIGRLVDDCKYEELLEDKESPKERYLSLQKKINMER